MTDIGIRDISVSFHDNKISNISLVQGDALTRGFDITFVNAKGETLPVDDDYIVELIAVNSKDKDTPYACRHEVVDDKYRVMIPPEALSESGSITIQLIFYQKSTKAVIHTIKQKCPVYQSIGQEFVESNNLYVDITALRLGLEKIEKLDGKYEEIIEKDIEIQANEIDRKEAEKKRNLDEEIRKDNEAIRNSNEEKREQLKTALIELKNRTESDLESINLTVDDIVSSEDDRKQNEIVREEIKVELENLVADIQNKLDNGDFVGEKGDQGIQGEQGPQGPPGEVTQEEFDNLSQEVTAHKEEYIQLRQQDQLKVATVEKELQNYKSTMANINVNQEAKQKISGYGIVNLPKNAANGQVSASLKGNTVADENGTKSTISASRFKSVGKDGIQESTQYLPNVGELRSLPNGVHDEIKVSGGKAELVKRVSDELALPMSGWYFNRANEQGFVLLINYTTLPNFAKQSYGDFIPTTGMVVNNSNLPAYTTTANEAIRDNANTECIATIYHTGLNLYIVVHQDNYNKTQNSVGANAWVNENIQGITLTYQLAEPIITPIEVSGTLLSNPSGTVYVENVVADAGIYDDGISVLHQDLPIKEVEKVSKVDFMTGVETDLDVSECEVSEDSLSFTHPDLTDGDIVFFTYYYDVESTLGETTLEYYDSRHVLKDTVTGKFYKVVPTVANGVLTNGLVEV